MSIYAASSSGNTLIYTGGTSGTTPNVPAANGSTFLLVDAATQQTLATVAINPVSAVQFSATPNPITDISLVGSVEAGVTTLNWTAPPYVSKVEVHIGGPDGVLFGGGGQSGTAQTGLWAQNGMTFYLQGVTAGKPLTAANTLALTTVLLQHAVQFSANPNPITNSTVVDGLSQGATTLNWNVSGVQNVEIHLGAPLGQLVEAGGPSGSVAASQVTAGTMFYLQDVTGGLPLTYANTMAVITVQVQ